MLQKITFFKEERCYKNEKTFQKIVALALANHYKYKKVRILLSISSPSLIIENMQYTGWKRIRPAEYARKSYEVRAFHYLLKEKANRELGEERWSSFAQRFQTYRIPAD